MSYADAIESGIYKYIWSMPFEDHLASHKLRILRAAPVGTPDTLSVGCGDGGAEAALVGKLQITCQDTHDLAKRLHPELTFVENIPDKKFDYIVAIGAVLTSVPTEEQDAFLEKLFSHLKPGGTLLLGLGYYSFPLEGDVREYRFENKTVFETYHNVTDHSFDVTTKVLGLGECTLRYYPCDVKAKLAKFAGPFRILH